MTTARVRSSLASALRPLGFEKHGSNLVLRQPELAHVVSVNGVRRLSDYVEVTHGVFPAATPSQPEPTPLIEETVQGFKEPFAALWAIQGFEPSFAARQSAAVVAAFSSLTDVAHFYSDRAVAGLRLASPSQPVGTATQPRSLSQAQADALLQGLAQSIFSKDFARARRLGADIWVRNLEVGGYRHCAYLVANTTATLASLQYFSFATLDIEKGRKSNEVMRLLLTTPKRILSHEGQPVLLPFRADAALAAHVSSVLIPQLDAKPPNELPRNET